MVRYHYLYSDDNLLCKLSCGRIELPNNVLDEGMVLLVHSFFHREFGVERRHLYHFAERQVF